MDHENLLKLLFEAGVLTRKPRTGPYHVGITDHETSAAHSFRTSLLAYFLAEIEEADTNKVLKMCLAKDLPETRTLNQSFIEKRVLETKGPPHDILSEQLRGLNGSQILIDLFKELDEGKTLGSNDSKGCRNPGNPD